MTKPAQPGRDCTLDELLGEPMIRALMRSDGVQADDLRALVAALRAKQAARTAGGRAPAPIRLAA